MRKNVKKNPAPRTHFSFSGNTGRPLYWIGLVCITSLWMFIFGVLVGRGTAPISMDIKKLQKELAEITQSIQAKEEQDLKDYADRIDSKTELEFYESLKENEKNIPKDDPQKEKTPPSSDVPVKKSLARATKNGMMNKNTVPEPQNGNEVSESPTYRWTIQVSSVKNSETADKMVADLIKQGHPAYKVMARTPENDIFYRVRIGPYKDKNQADQQLSDLKKNDYDAIMISM